MKKLLTIAAIAAFMISCNDEKKTETPEAATTTTGDSAMMDANQASKMTDSATNMMNNAVDTANKMMDKAADKVEKAGEEAKKMMDKAADHVEKAADKMSDKKHP
jgi:ElaB/YqjD/DUF883 family membrane-anchored ribosome-binding protein